MDVRFITPERIKNLQNSIGWLDNYTPPKPEDEDGDTHIVGNSVSYDDRDVEMTDLLNELGKLNERRKEIINKFMEK